MDSTYVVKMETRDGNLTGHPLVSPSTLAVQATYRDKETARVALREVAHRRAAYELARAAHRPSPASLNVIPLLDNNLTSIEVLTVEGLLVRYFLDEMPIE